MPRTKQMPAIRPEAITLSLLTSDLDWAIRSPEYTPTETSPSDRDSTRTTIAVLPPVNYIHFGRQRCPECGEDTEHLFVTLKDDFVSYAHAFMERTPDGWMIRDSRSMNGTFMQGSALTTEMTPLVFDGADQCLLRLANSKVLITRG